MEGERTPSAAIARGAPCATASCALHHWRSGQALIGVNARPGGDTEILTETEDNGVVQM